MTLHAPIATDAPLLLDPTWRVAAASASVPPDLYGTHAALFYLLRQRRLQGATPIRPAAPRRPRAQAGRPRWDELATQLGAGTMDQLVFHRLLA